MPQTNSEKLAKKKTTPIFFASRVKSRFDSTIKIVTDYNIEKTARKVYGRSERSSYRYLVDVCCAVIIYIAKYQVNKVKLKTF